MLNLRSLSLKYTHFAKKALVNSINIFGISPQLTVTKAKKFNTLIGSLFTILLLVAILILILYDLNELVLREKPIVIISEGELDLNKEYWLKKQNFTFSFGILNKDMIAIEEIERYFSFQIKFCQKNKTKITQNGQQQFITNCINLETVPCERKYFSEEVYNIFEFVNISNYRCINPNQLEKQKISLQGTIFSNDNNYLTIELFTCKNNQSCYEENIIQNLLQQAYYSQILPDTQFQWQNSKNLTKQILRNEYSQIFSQQSRIINLQYQIVENQLDSGYAFQDFSYHEYLKIFTLKEEINFHLSDKLIYQEINLNQKLIKNTISYTKLSTFFSKLGGYIYFLLILIQFLIYPINKLFYILDLINKIFRLKIVQDDLNVYQQENDNNIIRSPYFQNLETPNSYCWANVNENLLSQSPKITIFLEKMKNTISITVSQLVQLILGCNSLKKEQIMKIEKKINRKLDIVYIISKLQEIDKLKFILLNEDQINLFNSLQKPILLLDQKNTKEQTQFFEEDSKNIKLQKGFKSYVNMQDKQQKDATDFKLLSLLDNDLIQLFEQLYHELTFKSFFQDIQLKESKTFKVQKNSKDNSPQQKVIIQKHIKLQTNADQ